MMYKKPLKIIVFILILSIITTSFTGCIDPIEHPQLPKRGFFMGLLPIPSEGQDFSQSYQKAAQYSEFVPVWSSGAGADGFWDYADKLDDWWGDTFITGHIRGNGMYPLIHFSFIDKNQNGNLILKTPNNLPNASLKDPEWRALYKLSILNVVNTIHPAYISLGNEVNRWYEFYGIEENNSNGFQHFVSLYEEIYDAIKEISPETTVFCVFSREIVDENREADLDVLTLFNTQKLDLLVFTTYPIAVQGINTPSDIPTDYYLQASECMPGKPFGFSEIGWPTYEHAGGEQGQYDFLMNLSTILTVDQGINLHLFMYCWLHDLTPDDTVGLIKIDGTEKMGYLAWKSISYSSLWQQQLNEKIVFMSKADSDDGELYLLDKTNMITRLTYNNRHENNPALSFDGKKVAFHGGDTNNPLTWEIFVIDLETLEETQLTNNNVIDGHPDWSPEGDRIVFGSFKDEYGNPASGADLYIMDLDGNEITQLTNNEWEDNDPEWSPDGTKIVFKSNRITKTTAREEIFVMDSNGENVRRLTTTTDWQSDHDPSWSPDSSSIAYNHYAGIRPWTDLADLQTLINQWDELIPWNVFIVDLQGNVKQVTNTDYIAGLAVFSKDGNNILFLDNEFIIINDKLRGMNHRLTIINPDGTMKQQLIPDDEHMPTLEYFDW